MNPTSLTASEIIAQLEKENPKVAEKLARRVKRHVNTEQRNITKAIIEGKISKECGEAQIKGLRS